MALSLGVAAIFIGIAMIIVGWKGGGPQNMETNIIGMLKGEYLPTFNPGQTSAFDKGAPTTATTGGANSSGKK